MLAPGTMTLVCGVFQFELRSSHTPRPCHLSAREARVICVSGFILNGLGVRCVSLCMCALCFAVAAQLLAPAKHGKSSLMKVLAGRIPPSAVDGKVRYSRSAVSPRDLTSRRYFCTLFIPRTRAGRVR